MILSIQSHVAYGYVGNRAAVFPLQRLGFDVSAINTVQFSNHTGYGSFKGDVFTPAHISALIDGLRDRDVLKNVQAVLSGYMGAAGIGQIILDVVAEVRSLNPAALYCCDPVMGDTDRGMFVKDDIPPFFRDQALHHASIITPNQYELSWLTGITVTTLDDAIAACKAAINLGARTVLLTSLLHDKTEAGTIQMLVVSSEGEQAIVTTPRIDFAVPPNGSGDATTALFLGHYLQTRSLSEALGRTASAIFGIFEATQRQGSRELALIAAQDGFAATLPRFTAIPL